VHAELEPSGQIVLCYVSGRTTSYCTVVVYEKDSRGVLTEVMRVEGRVGSTGIEPEESRVQNSGKTPSGVHRLIAAFGINDDPGAKFDYIKVTPDMYWDLNSGSPTYNRLVYSYPGGDCEQLSAYTRTYRYAFVTDYNYEQTPGKGGAIFLHCDGAGATSGCVSIPEENMLELMKLLDPAKNPTLVVALENEIGSYIR
jgi:L,D-peptidoglycan transpeptidase YkuD (ErfK/YbiS/YcfS/YnhG family)